MPRASSTGTVTGPGKEKVCHGVCVSVCSLSHQPQSSGCVRIKRQSKEPSCTCIWQKAQAPSRTRVCAGRSLTSCDCAGVPRKPQQRPQLLISPPHVGSARQGWCNHCKDQGPKIPSAHEAQGAHHGGEGHPECDAKDEELLLRRGKEVTEKIMIIGGCRARKVEERASAQNPSSRLRQHFKRRNNGPRPNRRKSGRRLPRRGPRPAAG